MKHQYIIPIFVPHLGCPNDCIFCNQKSISGQKKNMTKEEAKKIIDDYLKNIKDKEAQIEIAFFGGSFTAIEETLQNELLELAYEYVKNGKVESIRISTRPDCINKDILKRLKKYKVKTIELGVQSSNNTTNTTNTSNTSVNTSSENNTTENTNNQVNNETVEENNQVNEEQENSEQEPTE